MKSYLSIVAASALVSAALSSGAAMAQDDKAALAEQGKGLIKQFATALQGELKSALETGGAPHAIGVCNEKAPQIAARVSGASGWSVGRSSHKLRNPRNAPDTFTAAAMQEFLARVQKGENPEALAKAAIVEENGKRVFRLVKAIPTGQVCLNCHGGSEVKQPVVDKLAKLYPKDEARGFKMGDMRGVFTLSKALD